VASNPRRLLLIAAVLQLVWGLVPSASKFVIDEIPVELYIALRWSISGAIFGIYLCFTRGWKKVSIADVVWVSLLGILGYGVASLGTLYGLKVGGVTNFALMGAVSPVITSLVAMVVLRERPRRLFFITLPISVLGLFLLALGKYQISSVGVVSASVVFILGGYLLEAFVFVFSKRFKAKMSTVQYLAIAQISTAVLLWILQGAVFHQAGSLVQLSFTGLVAAGFVSVVACVLCYAVLYWLLHHIDGHRLALFDGFHTLSATLFGFLFFREPLEPLMLLGGFFVLIALVAGNWPAQEAFSMGEANS